MQEEEESDRLEEKSDKMGPLYKGDEQRRTVVGKLYNFCQATLFQEQSSE